MRDVLFVQGAGRDVHETWDSLLVESLRRELGPRYNVHYPRMPNEDDPTMETWGPVIERELASLRPGAIVIGHSVGGTMAIHVLADRPPIAGLGAILLIAAPFIGEGGWSSEEIAPRPDLAERLPANVPIYLYHGETDAIVPVEHVERYSATIPRAHVRRLVGRDHQLNNDLSDAARDIRVMHSHV